MKQSCWTSPSNQKPDTKFFASEENRIGFSCHCSLFIASLESLSDFYKKKEWRFFKHTLASLYKEEKDIKNVALNNERTQINFVSHALYVRHEPLLKLLLQG